MSGVQSIERAFSILRALAQGPAGITELSDRVELPKSTVSRLLGALENEGAVAQEEVGGDYQLGSGLADLAGAAAPGHNLITAARPHLLELTRITGETAGLAVAEGNMTLYLDHTESEEDVQIRSWTGERIPLHLVSSGLVLLAGQPPAFRDRYLKRRLEATTERSMTDPAAIRARLEQVAGDGYAWVRGEFHDEISSVAAPVTMGDETVAAIHIHGPSFRFPEPGDGPRLEALVTETAARFSAQLIDPVTVPTTPTDGADGSSGQTGRVGGRAAS